MAEKLHNGTKETHSPTMECLMDPKRSTAAERAIIDRLKVDYSQPHRHYHTLEQHITQMMAFLDANSADLKNRRVAVLATLYHDSVYNPHAAPGENEIASAKQAAKDLSGHIYSSEIDKVQQYILATIDHVADPNDPDMQLFIDADLSVLGAPADVYRRYATDIRSEYDWLSDEDYAKERSEILYNFLGRDRIFMTDTAHRTMGERANLNMIAELHRLSTSG